MLQKLKPVSQLEHFVNVKLLKTITVTAVSFSASGLSVSYIKKKLF